MVEQNLCGPEPNEIDLMMRVVDPVYDIIWSWFQTFDTKKALDKLKKRASSYSSSRSTSSAVSTVDARLGELSMMDKIALLESNLKRCKKEFTDSFFDDLAVSMGVNDNLYPGIKDVDFIARYLYRESNAYKGLVMEDDIVNISLAMVIKYIFFSMAKFLLDDRKGPEAMKYLILPSRVNNASYDICRKRFCNLVVEETSIVPHALIKLSRQLKKPKTPVTAPVAHEETLTESKLMMLDVEVQTDDGHDEPQDTEEVSQEHIEEPMEEPQEEPAKEPEEEPVKEPEEEPVEEPLEEPEEEPVKEPLEEPEEEPEKEPETEPDKEAKAKGKGKGKKKKKSRPKTPATAFEFPTPLSMALNNVWPTPWPGYTQPCVARSVTPSLKSYQMCSSSSDEDSD